MGTELSAAVLWAILGIVLLIAEIFTMSFFMVFFGIGAVVVALLKTLGFNHLPLEIITFTMLGVGGIFVFRKKMVQSFSEQNQMSLDQNQKITLSSDLPARGSAQVYYQGSTWTAVNESGSNFKKGDEVVILRTESIKLIVGPATK